MWISGLSLSTLLAFFTWNSHFHHPYVFDLAIFHRCVGEARPVILFVVILDHEGSGCVRHSAVGGKFDQLH